MIINFNFTRQNQHNEVEYFNSRGQIVKTYYLSELNSFVSERTSLVTQDEISDHIDENWVAVTQSFYNSKN